MTDTTRTCRFQRSDSFPCESRRIARAMSGMHRTRHGGFTLVEVMVVIAVAATLSLLAMPALSKLVASSRTNSHVNAFVTDARLARNEAMRLGQVVTMCRAEDPEATQVQCRDDTESGGWQGGWIVFVDADGSKQVDAGETVLKIQQSLSDSGGIAKADGSASPALRYRSNGRASAANATLKFWPAGGADVLDASTGRTVCISGVGRVRVAGDASASCSS